MRCRKLLPLKAFKGSNLVLEMSRLSEKGLMKKALDGGINCMDHPFSYTLEGRPTKRNIEQDRGGVSIEIVRPAALRQRNGLAIAVVQVLLCGYGPHLSERGIVDEIGRPHPTISYM